MPLFKKGEPSANPFGRPPVGQSQAEKVRQALARIDPRTGKSQEELILLAQINLAKKGNLASAAWLWDRGFGKVAQQIDVDSRSEQRVLVVPWLPALRDADGEIVTSTPGDLGDLAASSPAGALPDAGSAGGSPTADAHGEVRDVEAEVVTWGDQAAQRTAAGHKGG